MSTNQLSHQKMQRSRNMQSDILHAVAESKQVNVAKCLGVDSSTVGRWLDAKNPESQVVRFCDMLAICGLKIVPANTKHYDAAKIEILFRITKDHFQRLDAVDDFFHDDIRYSRVGGLSDANANRNIVLGLLLRLVEAGKNLVAIKTDRSERARLIARLQIEEERQREIKDIVADEAFFRKLIYVVIFVAAVAFILSTLMHFA